jgi:hypothetical protein
VTAHVARQRGIVTPKGSVLQILFYGISIKNKKILIPEGSAGCNKTDQLYEIKKENHLPKQII